MIVSKNLFKLKMCFLNYFKFLGAADLSQTVKKNDSLNEKLTSAVKMHRWLSFLSKNNVDQECFVI
jgi:hypothetical protein